MLSWNQPTCERCWIIKRGRFNPDGLLLAVEEPYRMNSDARIERCAWCGQPTIVGIYVRADPAQVPYPGLKEEEPVG